jgi:hypothetical protein
LRLERAVDLAADEASLNIKKYIRAATTAGRRVRRGDLG